MTNKILENVLFKPFIKTLFCYLITMEIYNFAPLLFHLLKFNIIWLLK